MFRYVISFVKSRCISRYKLELIVDLGEERDLNQKRMRLGTRSVTTRNANGNVNAHKKKNI